MNPRLTTLHMTRTYGGSLEGPPPVDTLIRVAHEAAEETIPGNVPIHMLPPVIRQEPHGEVLPDWQFAALLNGEPLDEENDGAQLVMIWWASSPAYDIDAILDAADKVWREKAVDYQW